MLFGEGVEKEVAYIVALSSSASASTWTGALKGAPFLNRLLGGLGVFFGRVKGREVGS
jgi:hypothetical protein